VEEGGEEGAGTGKKSEIAEDMYNVYLDGTRLHARLTFA
jgi:hypothetical protein